MYQEITAERFEQLVKMINFLESIDNVKTKFFSEMEGMKEGVEVICIRTHHVIMTLLKNNPERTFFMKE